MCCKKPAIIKTTVLIPHNCLLENHTVKPWKITAIEKTSGNNIPYHQAWQILNTVQDEALGNNTVFSKDPCIFETA
jgi:hypothetical protein